MEIYTFSGTGNSLHTARELAARFPDASLHPIIGALGEDTIEMHADVVGLVFPVHAFTFPWAVKRFLEKANFDSASYIFAVATRECFARVFSDIDKLLERQNKKLDAYFSFEMPQNYIPVYNVYSQERRNEVEARMLERLDLIEKIVAKGETFRPKDPPGWFLLSQIVFPVLTAYFQNIRFPNMEKSFYADHNCNGCGICEQVCLTNKIRIEDGKPVWQDETKCAYCFACLHYCPEQAIQIRGRRTARRGRYHHPAITVKDIASQKS